VERGAVVTIVCGIDPGLSGAICMLDTDGTISIDDMPVHALKRGGKNKREIDPHRLAVLLSGRIGHAFIEQVSSMPGQGVSSVFAFGKTVGVIIGVLATHGVPMTFISPVKWKKALQVPASKDGARARASQLIPQAAGEWPLVKHDGRAEAALIALYGIRSFNGIAQGKAA
jgi:crossover junction endodeoxyribonuclease RuvC